MGNPFSGSSSDTSGVGPVADGGTYGNSLNSGVDPVSTGDYFNTQNQIPNFSLPSSGIDTSSLGTPNPNPKPSPNPNDTGTNWGGLLTAGVGAVGAASALYRQNQANDNAKNTLNGNIVSPDTKDVYESTYRQNREMLLGALQAIYQKHGWTMPTAGGSSGSAASNTSVPSVPTIDRSGEDIDFTPSSAPQRAQAATGDSTPTQLSPNTQQKAANNIGAVLPTNAKDAYQTKMARSAPTSSDNIAAGASNVAGVVGKGAQIYNAAFNSAIQNGASESQASQAGSDASAQSGFSTGQIASYAQAAIGAYRALTDKNASAAQKGVALGQSANTAYGASGGEGAGYVGAGLRAAQVLAGNQGTDKQKATRAQQEAGLGVADMFSYGAATPAEAALRQNKTTGGALAKVDKLDGETNPLTMGVAHYGSSKGSDQMMSDQIRKGMLDAGVIHLDNDSGKQVWNLHLQDQNGNMTTYDIGADGKGGRKAHELDPNGFIESDGKTPTLQGRMTGRASALADLVTGGDEKQGTKFAGYFANAGLKAANGDDETGKAAMRDLYSQLGYKDATSAIAGIQALQKAGKIDDARAQAQMNSIRDTFGSSEAPQQNEAERTRPKPDTRSNDDRGSRALLRQSDDDAKNALQFKMAK